MSNFDRALRTTNRASAEQTAYSNTANVLSSGADLIGFNNLASTIRGARDAAITEANFQAELDQSAYNSGVALKKVALIPLTAARGSSVIFDATPSLTESGGVVYTDPIGEQEMTRSPAGWKLYHTTLSRDFQISAKLVSRTVAEAQETYRKIHLLKSWRMPQPGRQSPEVVSIYGYGSMIKGVPCVMTSLSIEYPEDIDTIDIGHSKIAIIHSVSIQLTETRTPDEIAQDFDLASFRAGRLPRW